MQGKATFRGHPLHLMFVSFPVAFWSGALVTDGAGGFTHDAFWFRMSTVLVVMGTVFGIVAAVFGYIDYLTAPMGPSAKRVATGHLVWSLGTLAAFVAALVVRLHAHASPAGIVLTAGGSALLFVAGYLGSALAVEHGVGLPDRRGD